MGSLSQSPYTERSVVRDTEFKFAEGNEVYELQNTYQFAGLLE